MDVRPAVKLDLSRFDDLRRFIIGSSTNFDHVETNSSTGANDTASTDAEIGPASARSAGLVPSFATPMVPEPRLLSAPVVVERVDTTAPVALSPGLPSAAITPAVSGPASAEAIRATAPKRLSPPPSDKQRALYKEPRLGERKPIRKVSATPSVPQRSTRTPSIGEPPRRQWEQPRNWTSRGASR